MPDTGIHSSSNSDISDIPALAGVLPMASLCASIFFALVSVVTWISLLVLTGFGLLIPLVIGLPLSLGGSLFLAFLPTVVLRFFVTDCRIGWSLWISGVSTAMSCVAWILIETLPGFGGTVC